MKYILCAICLVVSFIALFKGITENAPSKIIFATIGVLGFTILLYHAVRRNKT